MADHSRMCTLLGSCDLDRDPMTLKMHTKSKFVDQGIEK